MTENSQDMNRASLLHRHSYILLISADPLTNNRSIDREKKSNEIKHDLKKKKKKGKQQNLKREEAAPAVAQSSRILFFGGEPLGSFTKADDKSCGTAQNPLGLSSANGFRRASRGFLGAGGQMDGCFRIEFSDFGVTISFSLSSVPSSSSGFICIG